MTWTTAPALLVLVALFVGCPATTDPEADQPADSSAGSGSGPSERPGAREAECEVGARPEYYVPADGPPRIVGCADLSVSDKPVEFSVNAELSRRTD